MSKSPTKYMQTIGKTWKWEKSKNLVWKVIVEIRGILERVKELTNDWGKGMRELANKHKIKKIS